MLALGALSSMQSDAIVGIKGSCTDDFTRILFLHGSLSQNSSSGKFDAASVISFYYFGVFVPSLHRAK